MGFFDKIKAGLAKTRAALSNTLDEIFVSGNEIDTTADAGIRVRTPKALTITDNKIKNTSHNSITVEHGGTYPANTGAIVITGNTLENWGTSGEGRALRLAMGSGDAEKDVTFERNVMIHTDAPEEFAKITDAPEATVSVDENYWGGMDPHDAGFIAPEVPANYYTNSALTALAVYRAKLGDTYFVNVADAIAYATAGDVVTLSADAAINTADFANTVTINTNGFNLTVDGVAQTGTVTVVGTGA